MVAAAAVCRLFAKRAVLLFSDKGGWLRDAIEQRDHEAAARVYLRV